MAEFFQNVARAAPRKSAIEQLVRYRPTDFHGRKDEDASAAEYWFERTDRILEQMHCTPEERLECAVSLLQEDAYQWWTSVIQSVRPEDRTWELFQKEFRRKYVGRIYLDHMKREFTNLRQRQMIVTEYKIEFVSLSKYTRDMVATEADKCRRFEDGLNDYIRLQVAALEIKKEEQARRDRGKKRTGAGPSKAYQPQSKKFKKPQSSGSTLVQRPIPAAKPGQSATSIVSTPGSVARGSAPALCEQCGRRHPGECRRITGACFKCGSHDHLQKECPQAKLIPVKQSERPAPTTSRGRRPSQTETERGSHKGVSKSMAKSDI
ncbi:hypothetical protein ACOSP7_031925 [Xanthoceras sorbifolium]